MSMRKLVVLAVLVSFGVFPVYATAPVPRKSPELLIVEPSGKQMRLSSQKGKVVLIEFLLTNCPHCLRVAQRIAKLQWDFGSRGFQTIGVAFDSGVSGQKVTEFAKQFAVTYPIGYTSSEKVDSFLGRSGTERLRVPQIVVIDHNGIIRAQSRPTGEKNLEDETYLRNLIDSLLKERASNR